MDKNNQMICRSLSVWLQKGHRLLPYTIVVIVLLSSWSCGRHLNNTKDSELAEVRTLLDSAEHQHESNNILASFDILSKAREKAQKNGFLEEYITSLNMMSRLFAYIDDFEEAIQLNEEAYDFANKHGDSLSIMKALNNRGVIVSMSGDQDNALNIFRQLLQIAISLNDTNMATMASRNIIGIETNAGNASRALTLIDNELSNNTVAHNMRNNSLYYELLNLRAKLIQSTGNKDSANLIYDTLLASIPASASIYEEVLRNKALIEAEKGNQNKALEYLRMADVSTDPISRYFIYIDYSKVHELSGNLSQALIYKDSAIVMLDSVHMFSQRSYHHTSSLKFKLLKKEEEAKITALNYKIWLLFTLLVVTALLLGYLYLNRKRKVEKLSSELKLVKMEEELRQTQQEHSELKSNVDEYINRLKCHELSIAARDNIMKEVSEYLSTHGDIASNKIFLAKMGAISSDTDNLDSFLNHTRQTHPELFSKLVERHPELNQNDLRYLSLVYLQLSVNEIATLLNITPGASKKRKQRICSKIGLDSTTDLYTYLLSL